ncbi:MAG: alpha-L-fucosidase [Bacteroidales bacterium]|nr:alpha-L-fucosidase [Bacteroidales bacterium]
MKRFFQIILALFFLVLGHSTAEAQHEEGIYVPDPDPLVREKLERWQDLKFGLLMHWGPYCQWGVVESWSICPEDYGWCERKKGSNPEDYFKYRVEYENLKNTFNPVGFDPQRWARAAREAGMRYVVFTTKHHDGFCMFDTRETGYKVTDPGCPFHAHEKANIALEIFNAFRKEGLWSGAYFSKPDWHSEFYWWPYFPPLDRNVNYDPDLYPDRWEQFVGFTHRQVMELMTDYGQMDILWLDGGWVARQPEEELGRRYMQNALDPGSGFIKNRIVSQDIRMDELVEKARKLQPGLIVVDRAVPGKNQNYLTPENRVPDKMLPYPWESCIIAGGGWSWTSGAQYMAARELVHLLVDIVSKGGNLLLNIAPGPEGQWHPEAYDLLEEMGDWMEVNGEAIYGTRPIAPFTEEKFRLTGKADGTLYLICLADENEERIPGRLGLNSFSPADGSVIRLLGAEHRLKWKRTGEGFMVEIPEQLQNMPPCRYAWVLKVSPPG